MYSTLFASFLVFSTAATAASIVQRQTNLSSWKVTGVAVFGPSGHPGSYPWPTITANVTDPNTIVLSTSYNGSQVVAPAGNLAVNCQAKWFSGTKPTDHIWPCDPTTDGYWYLEIVDTPGLSLSNFDLKFTRFVDVVDQGLEYKKTFVGTGHFDLKTNLDGQCDGSGACHWALKNGSSPVSIQQTEIA
ncbi:cell death in tomato 1 [Pleomassaria siparia CBS 279.74]|uniref:Cell death in tomato 1 n=1 Tax=Pleomassaria siparia CBS 279.74 TaxID=1314801 RepID=A0A6G1KK21_9PLEO|nr:cell death in tomato 1 [Pleomassaria siparia CBS 279.74]